MSKLWYGWGVPHKQVWSHDFQWMCALCCQSSYLDNYNTRVPIWYWQGLLQVGSIGHQKDVCYDEIGVYPRNLSTFKGRKGSMYD